MKVKNIVLNTCIGLILFSVFMISCSEDEDVQPVITNVRVTVKDSTISSGEFNLVVAIQGTGLEGVQKVLFNDVEANLKPVYVTSTNIICPIPDSPPTELLNKITVVTASGKSATYDFSVILPPPVIDAVYNEFASSENKILGNYFYFVSKVMIGDEEVQVSKFTATEITFNMPEADVAGKTVTVVAAGGTSSSTFKFPSAQEGRIMNFDEGATVCWGGAAIVNPEDSDFEEVTGRYTQIRQSSLPQSWWQDNWVLSTCGYDFGLPAGNHASKMFKFEHNVVEPWKSGYYEIMLKANDIEYRYLFKPWDSEQYKESGYSTSGWRTAYIPLSEFKSAAGGQIEDISKINDFQFILKTPYATIDNFYTGADNFRIVDK